MPRSPTAPSGFASVISLTDRSISALERMLMIGSCACLAGMMALVSADTMLRYVFNSPMAFVQDVVVLYLLPASAFFAVSLAMREGDHVAVDALANKLNERFFRLLLAVFLTLSLVCYAVMAFVGFNVALAAWKAAETTGGVHPLLIWPSKIILPIGIGLLALRILHAAIANLHAAFTGDMRLAYPHRNDPYESHSIAGAHQ